MLKGDAHPSLLSRPHYQGFAKEGDCGRLEAARSSFVRRIPSGMIIVPWIRVGVLHTALQIDSKSKQGSLR